MPSVPERAAEAVSQVRENAKRSLSRRMPFPPALEDIVSQVPLEGLARAALLDEAGRIRTEVLIPISAEKSVMRPPSHAAV